MAREMFYHGFDSYMENAFPLDELNPQKCSGRTRDYMNVYYISPCLSILTFEGTISV